MAYWSEVIALGVELEEEIDYELISSFVYSNHFANKLSIKQQEHYIANQLGLRPEVAFEVRVENYDGEQRVKWNDKEYKLIRTYDNQKNGTIELYLTSELGDDNEF